MKIFFLVFFLGLNAYATEQDCEELIQQKEIDIVSRISIPNCYTRENLNKARSGQTQELCESCKTKFETISNSKITSRPKESTQRSFFENALKEYKKLNTDNLISAARLAALPHSGSDLKKSIQACARKSSDDFIRGCSSDKAKSFFRSSTILQDMAVQTSKELAKILSGEEFNPGETLLERRKLDCFVPEKDILNIASSSIEDSLTPELIEYIKNLNPDNFSSINDLFMSEEITNKFGDLAEFNTSFQSHPFLRELFKTPKSAIQFLRSIPSPVTGDKLRNSIYSQSNGNLIDKNLAESCNRSFEKLKDTLCSKEFEDGSLILDNFKNHAKLYNEELSPIRGDLTSNEDQYKRNEYFLSLCESIRSPNKNLSDCMAMINNSLPERFRGQSFEEFRRDKFNSEIANITTAICSGKENCTSNSQINTFQCRVYEKYKNLNDKSSLQYKLAHSSNKEGRDLLRAMLGDTSKLNLDSKTREVLIANGIIPKPDGTMVAQAEIPERQPGYFNNPVPTSSSFAQVAASTKPAPFARSQRNDYAPAPPTTASSPSSMPNFEDLLNDSDRDLQNVQDEIMRRLSGLPNNRPATKEAARKIAQDSFASRGQKLTPGLAEALASRMMQAPAPAQANANDVQNSTSDFRNETPSTSTQTAAQKYAENGMNRALADMQGARVAAANANERSPASTNDESAKPLTSVALNISEDPKVSLSQQFSEKFNKNDPETQLLKVLVQNKKPFLLQVRNVNFKVVFDEKNSMNLLLESGDKEEAQRLRPQLEVFFRRLRAI